MSERSAEPQNAAEHAARDRNIAHANTVVADLTGFAWTTLSDGGDPADQFVQVGLRCADAAVKCRPGGEVAWLIALLTAAVTATARVLDGGDRAGVTDDELIDLGNGDEPPPSAATIASVMAVVDAPYRPGTDFVLIEDEEGTDDAR